MAYNRQMIEIPLIKSNHVALIDNNDDWVMEWTWRAVRLRKWLYVTRAPAKAEQSPTRTLYLHRVILQAPKGVKVDHENGNGLDNRRENLRFATSQENGRNRGLNANNTSGHNGVHWHIHDERWVARIKVDYKYIHLGNFKTFEEALEARIATEIKYFGEFRPKR